MVPLTMLDSGWTLGIYIKWAVFYSSKCTQIRFDIRRFYNHSLAVARPMGEGELFYRPSAETSHIEQKNST